MKLAFIESINIRHLIALLAAGLLLVAGAVGCGDDDDDDDGGSDASVSAGGKGGGGSGAKGGTTAGKGGGGGAAGSTAKMTVAECETAVKARTTLSTESKCMCDKCTAAFGACAADDKCWAVVECGDKNKCGSGDQTCYTTNCMTQLGEMGGDYSLIQEVGTCGATSKCEEAADSGT
jgi:hypothetical protein